jgi:hypothetical protein
MTVEAPNDPTRLDGVSYPAEPWHLYGTAYLSLWQIGASRLPEASLSRDVRPRTVFGRVLVGTAFAVYEPSGMLTYDELLLAAQVRGGPLSVSVPWIWVDHPDSVAGARARCGASPSRKPHSRCGGITPWENPTLRREQ